MTIDYDVLFAAGIQTRDEFIVCVRREGKGWLRAGTFQTPHEALEHAHKLRKQNKALDPEGKREYAVGKLMTTLTFEWHE